MIGTSPSASAALTAKFPAANVSNYRTIIQDTQTRVDAGDQAGAKTRITDLETAWDTDQSTLQPMDGRAWTVLDKQIDTALKAVRAASPNPSDENQALSTLLKSFS